MKYWIILSLTFLCSCTTDVLLKAGEYNPNESVEVGDIVSIEALLNPERGLHVECNYLVHNYINPFYPSEIYPNGFVDQRVAKYDAVKDGITVTQLYLYLSEYLNKDIPQEGFDKMQTIFNDLKAKGFKAILRFAYNYQGMNASVDETEDGIKRHLDQLRPFIQKNAGQIAVWQAGFIGAWGEWHSSPLMNNQGAKNMIINEIFDILPEGKMVQLRHPDLKNKLVLSDPKNLVQIGFNNDFFTAGEHELAAGNDFVPGDKWYQQASKESPYFFMSGEMPYAEDTKFGLKFAISVNATLQCLRDNHYSAFDVSQNYEINIHNWKEYKLYPQLLNSLKVAYDDSYFKNKDGKLVARSAYDFIRDHLGYRLNVKESKISIDSNQLEYNIDITNTGFATIINPRNVYLVFIDENGVVKKEVQLRENPKDWQPFDVNDSSYKTLVHKIEGKISLDLIGKYKIGIWMPDVDQSLKYNGIYDIKYSLNEKTSHWFDSENKYVVNVIGEIKL